MHYKNDKLFATLCFGANLVMIDRLIPDTYSQFSFHYFQATTFHLERQRKWKTPEICTISVACHGAIITKCGRFRSSSLRIITVFVTQSQKFRIGVAALQWIGSYTWGIWTRPCVSVHHHHRKVDWPELVFLPDPSSGLFFSQFIFPQSVVR